MSQAQHQPGISATLVPRRASDGPSSPPANPKLQYATTAAPLAGTPPGLWIVLLTLPLFAMTQILTECATQLMLVLHFTSLAKAYGAYLPSRASQVVWHDIAIELSVAFFAMFPFGLGQLLAFPWRTGVPPHRRAAWLAAAPLAVALCWTRFALAWAGRTARVEAVELFDFWLAMALAGACGLLLSWWRR